MRLIDADALSEKLCKTTIFVKDGEVFQRMINDAPTVSAEAVEAVRCKDCRWAIARDEYIGRLWCSIHRGYMEDTYYCADGLRREDGEA